MSETNKNASQPQREQLSPVSKVAQYLCLSRSKVYQLMESGQLPYLKFGKSRRVRWSDVLEPVERSLVSRN